MAAADPDTLLFTSAFADEALVEAGPLFLDNEFGPCRDVNRFVDLARASARWREIMGPLGTGDELRVDGTVWGSRTTMRLRTPCSSMIRSASIVGHDSNVTSGSAVASPSAGESAEMPGHGLDDVAFGHDRARVVGEHCRHCVGNHDTGNLCNVASSATTNAAGSANSRSTVSGPLAVMVRARGVRVTERQDRGTRGRGPQSLASRAVDRVASPSPLRAGRSLRSG